MPRLKIAGNTKKPKRCRKETAFPCKNTCLPKFQKSGKATRCLNKITGLAQTSLEWLEEQHRRIEKINKWRSQKGKSLLELTKGGFLVTPKPTPIDSTKPDGRPTDNERTTSSPGDRRVSAEAKSQKIIIARPDITPPSDPSIIPERLRQFLTSDQQHGVSLAIHGMTDHGGFLMADGTGIGKTRQQLAIAQYWLDQGKKVLIVSPNGVLKPNFKKGTVEGSFNWDSEKMGIPVHLTKGTEPIKEGAIALSTYENLNNLKKQIDGNTVVIFDEAHAFKNTDSARTKHGMEMLKSAGKVLYATATPVDKPEHLPYLYRAGIFNGNKASAIYQWLGLQQKEIRIPGGSITKWVIPKNGAAAVFERMTGLFDNITEKGQMIKREISMKGVNVNFHTVPLPDSAYRMLDRIKDRYDTDDATGLDKAQMLMQQRRQLEPYKINEAIALAQKAIEGGDQVIIFTARVNESSVKQKNPYPQGTADAMKWDAMEKEAIAVSEGTAKTLVESLRKTGIVVTEIHGGTKIKAADAMNDFQSGKAQAVVATIESGGVGINLDDTTGDHPRTIIMMTPPFSAVENVQAIGRGWRLTTETYPRIEYLFTDTDVDQWNRDIIAGKMKSLGAATKGELGILSPDYQAPFGDRVESLKSTAPRPPEPSQDSRSTPRGFIVNKFDNYSPDGRLVKAGEGYARMENGRWITYHGDQVTPNGEIQNINAKTKIPQGIMVNKYDGISPSGKTVKAGEGFVKKENGRWITYSKAEIMGEEEPVSEPTKKTSTQKRSPSYEEYRKQNPDAHPDPIDAIHSAILSLDDDDRDRGREKNDRGWSGSTREFGRSLAEQIRSGRALTPKQLQGAFKLVKTHKRQVGDLPSQDDIDALIASRGGG